MSNNRKEQRLAKARAAADGVPYAKALLLVRAEYAAQQETEPHAGNPGMVSSADGDTEAP